MSISAELYELLRSYCDDNGLRFLEFVEDALAGAPQREEEMAAVRKAEDLAARVGQERRVSFRRGYWVGFCCGLLAAQGKMGVCEAVMPEELRPEKERFRTACGGQLELFK